MSPIADNSSQSGADTIATDDVTTLNGAGSTGIKVQRVKVGFGDDGSHRDASTAFPLPTVQTGAIPAGTNAIGTVAVNAALPAGTNNVGRFTRTTDGLRTAVSINYNATAPPTADALLTTLVLNKGATNTTGQTSIAVTAGKVLRLTSVIVATRATVATLPYGLLTLRVNHSGAAALASAAFQQVAVSGNAAVIGNTGVTAASIEDGFELSGTMQLGLSFSGNLATNVVSVSVLGYEYTA